MAAIAGYKGTVKGQTGPPAAFSALPMSDTGTTRITYQINDTTRRYWDNTVAPTVETSPDGVTWTVVNDYTYQPLGGVVTFNTARAAGTQVRVSGSAYPMAEFAGFTAWSADMDADMLETTALNTASGAKTYIPGTMSMSVSCDGFWQDSYFYSKLTDRAIAVVGLYVDAAGAHYDAYTYVTKLGLAADAQKTIDESRDFTVTGQFVYNAS